MQPTASWLPHCPPTPLRLSNQSNKTVPFHCFVPGTACAVRAPPIRRPGNDQRHDQCGRRAPAAPVPPDLHPSLRECQVRKASPGPRSPCDACAPGCSHLTAGTSGCLGVRDVSHWLTNSLTSHYSWHGSAFPNWGSRRLAEKGSYIYLLTFCLTPLQ